MPAPLKEVAIKTLDLEIWSGNAEAITIADQLYGAVVELISNKIDTPVTCAGILDLQIRLMPSVRKFGDEMDEDDRSLLYNQLMSIEEVARRLKLQAAFAAPTEEALALTTRFLHFDPSTNAYANNRWSLTYAQLLEHEYGALIRPILMFWIL